MPSSHVAVVGAGIVGLATALRLCAAGHGVTLVAPDLAPVRAALDAGAPPEDAVAAFRVDGATHAAAGMLAPLTETQHSQDALAPLLAAAWDRWPALLDLVAARTDAPTGHSDTASYAVGVDRDDVDQWAHVLARAERHGRRAVPLTGATVRRAAPALAPGLAGGFHAPDDHQVDPRLLVRALLAALLAPVGAVSVTLVAARATAVRQEAQGVAVDLAPTSAGEPEGVRADVVVLAAGLGHGRIQGDPAELPLPLRPVHGDILRLRVPAALLAPGEAHLLPGPVRALVHGRSVYLVPRAGGGLVVGASVREDALAVSQAGAVLDLLADATAVLPAVRECALEEVRTAARPGTPDDVPYVGALPAVARVVVATGAHRHGILLAPWMSAAAAALVDAALGRAPEDPEALALTAVTGLARHASPAADPAARPADRKDRP